MAKLDALEGFGDTIATNAAVGKHIRGQYFTKRERMKIYITAIELDNPNWTVMNRKQSSDQEVVNAKIWELRSRFSDGTSVIEKVSKTVVLASEVWKLSESLSCVPVFERERHPDGTVGDVLRVHHLTEDRLDELLDAQRRRPTS